MSKRKSDGDRRNSIGLHGNQLRTLLDQLDGSVRGQTRQFMRWPFRRECVSVQIIHADGSRTVVDMVTRNISAGGISLLHSSYLHVGTRLIVGVPGISVGLAQLKGVVRACRHVQGRVHEVGIEFEQRINLADFLPCDLIDGGHTLDAVDPKQLTGRVLIIDGSGIDRRIMRHLLRETALTVDEAPSLADARAGLSRTPDIVLHERTLATPDALATLRGALGTRPIVVVADSLDPTRESVRELDVDGFLTKPLDGRSLLRMLGEFLLLQMPQADLPANDEPETSSSLLLLAAEELAGLRSELSRHIAADNVGGAHSIAQRIRSVAAFAGIASLEAEASDAAKALLSGSSCQDAGEALRALERGLASKAAA